MMPVAQTPQQGSLSQDTPPPALIYAPSEPAAIATLGKPLIQFYIEYMKIFHQIDKKPEFGT